MILETIDTLGMLRGQYADDTVPNAPPSVRPPPTFSCVTSRPGLRHRHLQVHPDGSRAALRHGADRGPVQVHLPVRGRVHPDHQGQSFCLHGEQHRDVLIGECAIGRVLI